MLRKEDYKAKKLQDLLPGPGRVGQGVHPEVVRLKKVKCKAELRESLLIQGYSPITQSLTSWKGCRICLSYAGREALGCLGKAFVNYERLYETCEKCHDRLWKKRLNDSENCACCNGATN